ncbi:NAD(P)/FAD-dependent oxidoreductase [Microbacterium sp. zg.Y1090]|uniref:flavin-containing monooxygenase n=1 Tax=Microbacterium wangruii TaxID=3049073 RepID=UPI00214D9FFC|nr:MULTISPECIES: NAD(P)/FAD-dependent oxidoreductase [unclassified Microbacterium]MCR2819858.1 NAD(P)/FAD-dependent oxidoreductase [Microbacterium sp. zg.Y1090]MDL5487969.1 NAD(P)/FAD-dependent oxidoreductase [Microbacterium sp. zg-Y1211]WIM28585.1 NAD(P)/FAD-dependent oxidoreductase [Microbacterium sp. zg-Y1090]
MTTTEHDLIVVGAGFAGMYTTIHAARRGLDILGIEAGDDVGGTWYWNRYPGARCDVESIDYSYSFDDELQREWRWRERYATQPEILEYLSHVADRFDVRRHYRFGERVAGATWDEAAHRWTVRTQNGLTASARWLVMAAGGLSQPQLPDIPGRDSFTGEVLQTSAWPHRQVDFTGKRVAVIGTGSSGVQAIPLIAATAAEVVVYQRSANYSIPAFNHPIDDDEWDRQQQNLRRRRELSWNGSAGSPWTSHPVPFDEATLAEREAVFEESWRRGGVLFAKAFQGLTVEPRINDAAREFFERKLAERVPDPHVRAALTPTDHPLGTKRICTDSSYYETFTLPHVRLVNLREDPLVAVDPTGIRTATGLREHDAIVYATGFDAMTGALTAMDIRGRDDRSLRDEWQGFPVTYLGIGLPGFPNLLVLNGPGSPSVLSNMALTSEQQGEYALRLIDHCRAEGLTSAEARADAATAWTEHSLELADRTLFGSAPSWYTGSNIEGKARGFLPYIGGFRAYIDRADQVAAEGYRGFILSTR